MNSLRAEELMTRYTPRSSGTAETWLVRHQQAWEHRLDYMLELYEATRAAQRWIGPPLLVGWNDEVWDGHHRLLIAWLLALEVPCVTVPLGPGASA